MTHTQQQRKQTLHRELHSEKNVKKTLPKKPRNTTWDSQEKQESRDIK